MSKSIGDEKPDNHVDELDELLVRLFEQAIYDGASNTSSIFDERNKGKVIPHYAQKLADSAAKQIEDFYRNKILKRAVRKARATDSTAWYFDSDLHKQEIAKLINKSKIQEKINTIRVFLLKGMVYEQYVAPLEKRLEELKKEL